MRSITSKCLSCVLSLVLASSVLLGALCVPKKAHAVLPIVGGALAAAGVSDVAAVGAFGALLAACGFSLASSVGANPDMPVASWSDEQLERAADKLQSWIDHAAQISSRVELEQMLNSMPEPPEEPPDDDPDDDPPEVEGEKVQPKKSDATSPMDYMLAMLAVNGGIGLTGGFADALGTLVKWATAPESDGGGGFASDGDVFYPPVTSSNGQWTFNVAPYSNPYNFNIDESKLVASTGLALNDGQTYEQLSGPAGPIFTDCGTGYLRGNASFNPDTGKFTVYSGVLDCPAMKTYNGSTSQSWIFSRSGTLVFDGNYIVDAYNFSPVFHVELKYISPAAALLVNGSYEPVTTASLLYQIAGQNAQMQETMQQMQSDTNAAVATLQQMYANDFSQSYAGTPQYLTVQAPYYVESGKTDSQTGVYTANIVESDYNHGRLSQYSDAVATNTSSPQPGNTGYNPSDYKGNSSADQPPWQPLLGIHLDRVWPFSLIGDGYKTFQDVFSLDGGSDWDWHIVIPLSSWNIALGGAQVFDDYDLDLSMWRDLFVYLAPWFLLFVFLALLDMARRLWLRWNASGDGD